MSYTKIPKYSFDDLSDTSDVIQVADVFKADLPYYRAANSKLMIKGGETYVNTGWAGTPAGTYSADTTNYVLNKQGVKLTATAGYGGIHTVFDSAADLTAFDDGSASTDIDNIQAYLYISSADLAILPGHIGIIFYADTAPTNTNRAQLYISKMTLSAGDNYLNLPKSTFTLQGTFDWSAVLGVEFNKGGTASASMSFTIDALRLTKANDSGVADSFQKPYNGDYINELQSIAGQWYVGVDHDKTLVIKELSNTGAQVILSRDWYGDIQASILSKCVTDNYLDGITLYNSTTDFIRLTVANNQLTLVKKEDSNDVTVTSACSLDVDDICRLTLIRQDSDVIGMLTINGDIDNKVIISTTTSMLAQVRPGLFTTAQEGEYLDFAYSGFLGGEILTFREPLNNWQDYEPTYTWTTGTPGTNVASVARYTIVNNICTVNISYMADDGNGATALTISLPVTPKDRNSKISVNARQKVNATWSDPLAYINDDDGNGIQFLNFTTCTDAQAVEIIVSLFYEV